MVFRLVGSGEDKIIFSAVFPPALGIISYICRPNSVITMEHIDTYLIDFLRYTAGVSEEILSWVYPLTAAFAIAVLSYVCTAVFRFAVGVIPSSLNRVMEKAGLTMDQIDWVVCHQANARIIDLVVNHFRRDDQQFAGSAFKNTGRTFYPAMPLKYIDQFAAAMLVRSDIACYLAPPRIEEQRQFHRLYAHIDSFR